MPQGPNLDQKLQESLTSQPQAVLDSLVGHLNTRWGLNDPRKMLQEKETLDATLSLSHKLFALVEKLREVKPIVSDLERLYKRQLAINLPQLEGRQSSSATNKAASVFDKIVSDTGKEIKFLASALNSLETYSDWYSKNDIQQLTPSRFNFRPDSESGIEDIQLFDQISSNVRGVLELIQILDERATQYPINCRELATSTKSSVEKINSAYVPRTNQRDPLEDLLLNPDNKKAPALYRNNPVLTCFLTETLNAITHYLPVKTKKAGTKTDKTNDETTPAYKPTQEFIALARYIRLHADGKLHTALRVGKKFSSEACDAQIGLYNSYLSFHESYTNLGIAAASAKLEAAEKANSSSSVYLAKFKEGLTKKDKTLKEFDPQEFFADLSSLSKVKREAVKAGPGNVGKNGQEYMQLLAEIDKFYQDVATRHLSVSNEELFVKLYDFSRRKKSIDEDKRGKLELDEKQHNISFSAYMDTMGTLSLEKIAIPRVAYSEVIGKSWTEVKSKLKILTRYSQLNSLYTEMTPRRKTGSNMLVIGPYGCGKNEFARALMSDDKVIVINMTTERMLTKWFGEAEANVRRLFEAAMKIRLLYGKPVVICWDEFDALYAAGGSGGCEGTFTRMQKALQSVLDGDTNYEGVSMFAMSNEPDRIPVPIYRRFTHVQIIEALDAEDRVSLMRSFLHSTPLSSNFDREYSWNNFVENTEYISGEICGKIFESIFNQYIADIESKFGFDTLLAIDREAAAIVKEKGKVSPAQRAEIFREHTNGEVLVRPYDMEKAVWDMLAREDIKSAIIQQKNFYRSVKTKLAQAFSNDI